MVLRIKKALFKLPDILEFQLVIPLVEIYINMLIYSPYKASYYVFQFRLRLWKWKTEFIWGETRWHTVERIIAKKKKTCQTPEGNVY